VTLTRVSRLLVGVSPLPRTETTMTTLSAACELDLGFGLRVRSNQARLTARLADEYDVVVCGAGSSGSVVARRIAENPDVRVLLLEAGGDDDVPGVMDPRAWAGNIGGARDWGFISEPNPNLDGRRLHLAMGKVLGGGSSINAMAWSRGHASDWNLFAEEAADKAWNYESVLNIYRRIENYRGAPDPGFRGTMGDMMVQPAQHPHPIASAMLDAAEEIGIPRFESPNGALMEGVSGAAIGDVTICEGRRISVFRSYTFPYMDRPNLTVLTHALVRRIILDGSTAAGVEISHGGRLRHITAAVEVVLSLGAINTPKLLMHSGIGDERELRAAGIPVVQHLPGVGRNLQDHTAFDCVWEFGDHAPPLRNNGSEAVVFERIHSSSTSPDIFIWQAESPLSTPENTAKFGLPHAGWTLFSAIAHPLSRGRVRLSSADPMEPARVQTDLLSCSQDREAARACVSLSRAIGNSAALRPHAKREVMPGDVADGELDAYIRGATRTFWHQSGTAKMGTDEMSVVDGDLKVYGVQNLRIADGSIMPRITTGNTMAPCVVIGERAAEMLAAAHGI
jgi:choline dehydrogenase